MTILATGKLGPFEVTVARGAEEASPTLFSYLDLEERVPPGHPLRKIRQIVSGTLTSLDGEFEAL